MTRLAFFAQVYLTLALGSQMVSAASVAATLLARADAMAQLNAATSMSVLRSDGKFLSPTVSEPLGSMLSMTERTVQTLDTNKDGRVDPSEIASFATAQGLDASAASQEFASLDSNGDGALDISELSTVLGSPTPPMPAKPLLQVHQVAVPEPAVGQSAVPVVAQSLPQPTIAATSPPQLQLLDPWKREFQSNPVATNLPQPSFLSASSAAQQQMPQASSPVAVATASNLPAAVAGSSTKAVEPSLAAKGASVVQSGQHFESLRESTRSSAMLVVNELSEEQKAEEKAQLLEQQAAELRANSTALTRQTAQKAAAAGAKAAEEKASAILAELTELENKAKVAEIQAAALRAKSQADVTQADELMEIANSALTQKPSL